ncbi:MAG TPA: T9SS-dependent M36 family metallopeptidase [Flavobacteriaceae bacterium]|nr:T9SS-dependent M36 family metallopeptidase [Flavobacteriaceae bacterium]
MQKHYLKIFTVLTLLFSLTIYGQQDYSKIIQNYLEKNQASLRMNSNDFSDLEIYDQYYTKSMDLTHVFTIQEINNIPVFNGIGNFAIKEGKVVYFSNSFKTNIEKKANTSKPSLTAAQAVSRAAVQLGLGKVDNLEIQSAKGAQKFVFSKAGISLNEIPVELVYQPTEEGSLNLAWDLSIHTIDGGHWWSVRVDATTGKIIDKGDWIVKCVFPETSHGTHSAHVSKKAATAQTTTFGKAPVSFVSDGSQYEVFELPIESPNHGSRTVVSEPADATASPFGWHDTDGVAGPEYTITRGNNVWAYENRDGDSQSGYSPDGGSALDFIFPLDFNQDPSGYIDAATTNLFYMNNMMHDIFYQYGFDEQGGNFQSKNYSNSGNGNDYVKAKAQDGADSGPGNNATFGTPPDGQSPTMRMFTWSPGGAPQVLTVNSPTTLAGTYTGTVAGFGPPVPAAGITADFALLIDDNSGGTSTDVNDGCDVVTNAASLSGKIAVIRRGSCNFDDKVLNAQNAGAIAVIMVNNEAGLITMAGDDPAVTIPSILIPMTEGEAIITELVNGTVINGTIIESGPFQKDGDVANGVIAHEYGHGISNRLTGGPSQTDCLFNDEQMGEGWSDFFALVLTMNAGDQETDARGIATYVVNQQVNGSGIRQYPYTTDMTVNPFTYEDVKNQFFTDSDGNVVVSVHGVGSIWATILWDMTWALIDKYGFDPDVYNGTGGNNIAMQLVIDGLKLQGCNPGFVSGRDAILAADFQNNAGANKCLIWEVFAARGVGFSASQGLSSSIYDQTPATDLPPSCISGTTDFNEDVFELYPNPTYGILNIESAKINGEVQVNLFDINGRKVMGKTVNMSGQATLNVAGLSTGIYVVQLVSDGKTQTEKLIVQ